jgi:spermidine synthase
MDESGRAPITERTVGRHALADVSGCASTLLNDAAGLEALLRSASAAVGATVIAGYHHDFLPQGASAVVLLAESHASVHTWPEWGDAAIDAFTCGDVDPDRLVELVAEALHPSGVRRTMVPRTVPEPDGEPVFRFAEILTPFDRYEHDLAEVFVTGTSDYQEYLIGRSEVWGRVLVLDGVVQSTEADEFIYHEGIVHPACYAAGATAKVRNVLILGGGEGACLREVLRWPTVESVTMVDIDAEVVSACRVHLPLHHQGSFDDPRVTLIHEDAVGFLRDCRDAQFDVIVSDMTDPVDAGPSTFCFTVEYFRQIKRVLRPHGVVSVQAGPASPVEIALHAKVIRTMASVFPFTIPYAVDAPCYGRDLGFVIASGQAIRSRLTVDAITMQDRELFEAHRWLTPALLVGKLSVPPYLVDAVAARTDVYEDATPPATAGSAGWEI